MMELIKVLCVPDRDGELYVETSELLAMLELWLDEGKISCDDYDKAFEAFGTIKYSDLVKNI